MLSDAVLYGVRTFLDPDNARPRLPNQPELIASYTLEGGESTLKIAVEAEVHHQFIHNPEVNTQGKISQYGTLLYPSWTIN